MKSIKAEETAEINRRMSEFQQRIRRRKKAGFRTVAIQSADALSDLIDEYLDVISEIGLTPTVTGFCLYSDISTPTFYAMEKAGDERSSILKKFHDYLDEFYTQSGLAQSTNPTFSIFYGKSKLDWRENNTVTLRIDDSSPNRGYTDIDAGFLAGIPLDNYE